MPSPTRTYLPLTRSAWATGEHRGGPQRRQLVELDGGGVEIVAERILATRIEVQRAHDGGDTELLGAHREAGHGGGEPRKVCRRVNAGRSDRIAFHQSIHSDIGLARSVVTNDAVTRGTHYAALNFA